MYTLIASDADVHRPSDWDPDLVDIAGFFFLPPPEKAYEPSAELVEFLSQGEPPVFFGFGSLVIRNGQVILTLPQLLCISCTAQKLFPVIILGIACSLLMRCGSCRRSRRRSSRLSRRRGSGPYCRRAGEPSFVLCTPALSAYSRSAVNPGIARARAKLGVTDAPLPAGIHVIDSVQHDYLFPHCSGVVHHGK